MDAEDVAFSLSAERLWGKKPLARRGTRYARGIIRVEATGPLTVEIETSFSDPNLPFRMVTPIGFVLPKHHYEEVGTDAFGDATNAVPSTRNLIRNHLEELRFVLPSSFN